MAGDHRPLAGRVAGAEVDDGLTSPVLPSMRTRLAAEGVVAVGVVVAHRGAVAPAVRSADQALVDPGELERLVAELLLVDRAGGDVERPAPQQGSAVVGPEALGVEHPVVAHDVEHDPVAVVVGVERVEHVARRHLEPAHVGAGAAERDEADAGGAIVLPRVRERPRRPSRPRGRR